MTRHVIEALCWFLMLQYLVLCAGALVAGAALGGTRRPQPPSHP